MCCRQLSNKNTVTECCIRTVRHADISVQQNESFFQNKSFGGPTQRLVFPKQKLWRLTTIENMVLRFEDQPTVLLVSIWGNHNALVEEVGPRLSGKGLERKIKAKTRVRSLLMLLNCVNLCSTLKSEPFLNNCKTPSRMATIPNNLNYFQ